MTLSQQIEEYLLRKRTWVPDAELSSVFNIPERRFRQNGHTPGLCTPFAISLSDKGFKHIALATPGEWIHAKNAERRAAISRLRKIKLWTLRRSHVFFAEHKHEIERDTGQVLLFGGG